jgi:pilus assembly protein CpaB
MGRRTLLLITSILLAAVGTALIAAYVKGADSRAEKDQSLVSVEVVKRPVKLGVSMAAASSATSFGPELRRVADLSQVSYVTPASLPSITPDEVASTTLLVGQVLQAGMFGSAGSVAGSAIGIGPTQVAATFQLTDPQRVAGTLQPGMYVRVFGLPAQRSAGTVLPTVRVLKVGDDSTGAPAQTTSTASSTTTDDVPRTIITFAVSPKEEVKRLNATQNGGQLVLGVLPGTTGSAS